MAEIVQISTKIVYQNRWMTVREDQIRRRSGAEGIYGVVEKPHFAVIVPYEDGKVHLVQQYRYPVKGRYWEFPQGSWEHEPDIAPETVAAGELTEETGLVASKLTKVGFLYQGYGFSNQGYHIFFATGLTKMEKEPEPEEEDLIAEAFTLQEFEEMLANGTVRDATTMATYGLVKLKNLI
jgi:8-oxo-dGTP pyrophosphatase MutT (NUDIX family)